MTNPLEVIREFIKTHPAAGGLILGGVAVCAGVAIVATFGVDLDSDMPSILKFVGLGFLVAVLGYVLLHRVLMPIVVCGLLVIGLAYGVIFGLAQVFPEDQTLGCLAAWNCRATADAAAAEKPSSDAPLATAVTLPVPTSDCICLPETGPGTFFPQSVDVQPGTIAQEPTPAFGQLVFVQFAGAITRDAVRTFMRQLEAAGWRVQGVDGGGERVASAEGLSEVRHNPVDREAAEALAALLNEWRVIDRTFEAKENRLVSPGSLEIWMGR